MLCNLFGPLVKRLRHRPITPVTGVRFPHGSPGIMTAKVVHYIQTDAVLCESKDKVRWTLRQMSRPLAEQLAKSVLMARRIHPFPSRTRKLSYAALKILGGKLPGKIGRCRHKYSSLAQLVEHAAVNRRVVGSSPTGGARSRAPKQVLFFWLRTSLLLIKKGKAPALF